MKEINLIKSKEYYYLLGVLLGDGNILFNRVRIGVLDYDFISKCKYCFKKCLGLNLDIIKTSNNHSAFSPEDRDSFLFYIVFNSVKFVEIVKADISILDELKDKDKIGAFLEGIYDSEGCVDKNRKRIRLIMRDNSKYVINLISKYLDILKIPHSLRYFIAKERGWLIITISGENTIRFSGEVKFSIKRKRERIKNY